MRILLKSRLNLQQTYTEKYYKVYTIAIDTKMTHHLQVTRIFIFNICILLFMYST